MTSLLIKNGRVIDPANQVDRVTNLLVNNGKIEAFDVDETGHDQVIDATDKIVSPGLIDLNTQLREPGFEEDETITTGTAAALAGGYTTIACIPNTDPPVDTRASVEFIQHQAARVDNCNVLVIACVSKNREGQELAELGTLSQAGAVAFSDATRPIHNAELLRRALEYCLAFDRPIFNRPEVPELKREGIMHEGTTSMVLALPGMPAEAEDVMTARDLRLTESTGGRLHLMDISSAGSVEQIRRAKARGVVVTADITPLHFTLTDETLRSFDTNYKIDPPLRSHDHVEGCIAGLRDGTLEVIASGHVPRASEKKMLELDRAPFGAVGLETTLSLVITQLIQPGHLDWQAALAKLTCNPARVLGIDKGTLSLGADADITIIAPNATWTVTPKQFQSKSHNTPLDGRELQGRAETVIVGGVVK